MKRIFLAILVPGVFISCSGSSEIKKNHGEVESSIVANDQTEKELEDEIRSIREEEEAMKKEIAARSTKMEFDRVFHDFGNVGPDSDNITQFVVKNVGDKPLIIEDVSASCGCTMPKKPEKPILPGKTDVIEVKFHPKPGQVNEIKKTVTVTANTDPKVSMLEIRAFVLGK